MSKGTITKITLGLKSLVLKIQDTFPTLIKNFNKVYLVINFQLLSNTKEELATFMKTALKKHWQLVD